MGQRETISNWDECEILSVYTVKSRTKVSLSSARKALTKLQKWGQIERVGDAWPPWGSPYALYRRVY